MKSIFKPTLIALALACGSASWADTSSTTSGTGTTGSSSGTTTSSTATTGSTTSTGTGSNTTTSTSSTTTSTTTPPTTATAIAMTQRCGQGGTRSTKGSFDLNNGALDITVTLAHCGGKKGVVVDGTDHIAGTFQPVAGTKSQWLVDLTDTIDQTDSGGAKNVTVARKCTITKKGTYDEHKDQFDGEVKRTECAVTGKFPEEMGIVEHLLKQATQLEEDAD